MQMTGHKTRSVFERYNIVSETDLRRRAVRRLDERDGHSLGTRGRVGTADADDRFVFIEENWRRRPDLNRGWRFCRPLPYLLATAPLREQCWPNGQHGIVPDPQSQSRTGLPRWLRRSSP